MVPIFFSSFFSQKHSYKFVEERWDLSMWSLTVYHRNKRENAREREMGLGMFRWARIEWVKLGCWVEWRKWLLWFLLWRGIERASPKRRELGGGAERRGDVSMVEQRQSGGGGYAIGGNRKRKTECVSKMVLSWTRRECAEDQSAGVTHRGIFHRPQSLQHPQASLPFLRLHCLASSSGPFINYLSTWCDFVEMKLK